MDKDKLELMKRILDTMPDEYTDVDWTEHKKWGDDPKWTDKYRPSRNRHWEWNHEVLPDWLDDVVKEKRKAKKKPVVAKPPAPPKRKAVKKSSKVGGALAQTLNEL